MALDSFDFKARNLLYCGTHVLETITKVKLKSQVKDCKHMGNCFKIFRRLGTDNFSEGSWIFMSSDNFSLN